MTGEPTTSQPSQGRRARAAARLASVRHHARPSTAAPLALVSGAAVGMYSVPRYHPGIVLAYVALLAALAVAVLRPSRLPARPGTARPGTDRTGTARPGVIGRAGGAVALVATGIAVLTVPSFSYLPSPAAATLRLVVASAAVVGGLAVLSGRRRGPDVAAALAAAAYAATTAAAVRLDPAPRIDVWYTLQGAADGLLHGEDLYRQAWVGPPGPMQAFTYLPWTAVTLAPGRWLAGDVRWALAAVTLCTAAAFLALARTTSLPSRTLPRTVTGPDSGGRAARVAAALLLLLPGTLTQVEQAWTEPLLLGCLTAAFLAVSRGRTGWAVVAVAVALASKQHIVLLLPVLAAWRPFGVRRAVTAALAAGVLVLPWFVADPAAMWHDTVRLLVDFPPLRFADTLYIALINEFGVQAPFWLTGAVVLTTLGGAVVLVRRRSPDAAAVLRWCALVLFVASLVNKQAFYNQYWLVAGLVLASWAVPGAPGDTAGGPASGATASGATASDATAGAGTGPEGSAVSR